MLFLENIELVQFRNYFQSKWQFSERIIAICGLNGTGKTNLLDAIYYLSFSRSYFSRTDAQSVQHHQTGMRIAGNYSREEKPLSIQCILRETNKKELWLNGAQYKKISDHIGQIPAVMIAPDDIDLVTGSSEGRRKLIDTVLSQTHPPYLKLLIDYNKVLQQRNALLKQTEYGYSPNNDLLTVFNEQLASTGHSIYGLRKDFMEVYIPLVQSRYEQIAAGKDSIAMTYESQLHQQSLKTLLESTLQKDMVLQRTNSGIHKDDIGLALQGYSFKSEASQGQRKSMLFALKLAEWDYVRQEKGFAPILLLDDVFEKLDADRMFQLLMHVCSDEHAQIFITDTHADRLKKQIEQTKHSFQLIELG